MPDELPKSLVEWLDAADKANAELRERARGLRPPPGGPRLGSYAEDFPDLMAQPQRDPTREPWWGRER